ncbi:MAG: RsfS/YbeB/iojap family protein, partial [Acidimicrobiia bacterium]
MAAQAADAKKAHDIVIKDVGDILAVTEHFVIASAPNTRQVRTIVDTIIDQVRVEGGRTPRSVEGLDDLQWVLLD